MKLLIIGNRKHQLLCGLIEDIRKEFKNKELIIDILSQETSDEKYGTDYLYDTIHCLKLPVILNKFRPLRGFAKQILFRSNIKNLKGYDYVHIHYVEDIILRDVTFFLRNIKTKLIISIWGSDFYRASSAKKENLLQLLNESKTVSIANPKGKEDVLNYYGKKLTNTNFSICKFTIKQLYDLEKLCEEYSRKESKEILNIKQKLIITIGYNASKMQQHLLILDTLEQHSCLLKYTKDIQFVLPVTYPKDSKYQELLNERSQNSPFEIKLFTEFMSDENVSHLRNATDIMIQLQTTDMFSASMIEHLAAQNNVITGSWLPYEELSNWGLHFNSINSVTDIGDELCKTIQIGGYTKEQLKENSTIIKKELNRDKLIKNWADLYK